MLKRLVCVLLCIAALLCAAAACADAIFGPVAFNPETDLNVPNGIVFSKDPSFNAQTGVLTFTVDSLATDWDQVVLSGFDAESNFVFFSGVIQNPQGDGANYRYLTSSSTSDDYLKDKIDRNEWGQSSGDHVWSWELGQYDASKNLFIPIEETCSIVVGWNDGADQRLLRILFSFTDTSPQPAGLSMLPAECISGLPENMVSAGNARHERAATADPAVTRFTMPDPDMDPDTKENDWTVHYKGSDGTNGTLTASNGVYTLETDPQTDQPHAKVVTYTLEYLDPQNVVRATYTLVVTIKQTDPETGDLLLWPAYKQSEIPCRPFAANDPSRIKTYIRDSKPGLSVTYQDGLLRMKTDPKAFVPYAKGDLSNVWSQAELTPPEGAAFLGFSITGGDVIFGQSNSGIPQEPDASMPIAPVEWDYWLEGYPFFMDVPYSSGDKIYYGTPEDYTGEFSGRIAFLYWYRADENGNRAQTPFLIEYLGHTSDPVTLETDVPLLEDESELSPEDEGKPFLVIQDKGTNQHTFRAKMYPTGENRHYYELKVMNKNGKEIPLNNAKCRLYLPYPPGYDEANAHLLHIAIHHYNKKGDAVEDYYSLENGTITLTENGLCIHVDSLSPFTVEWSETADAALPQTGDPSRPLFWLALLSLAACLTRRMRRA